MKKQKKWSLMRVTGSILICIGLVATAVATQGTSAIFEIIALGSLFIGLGVLCLLAYGIVRSWACKGGTK
ncbi:hypothetical protein LCGC14_1194480 [marine sediment metagenome]|uniref:Uncharacterized protein n=1 Tax=marine sediment metagenome TaxID=412755 RepID=A0A0F9PNT0_9ZZZZ